MTSMFLLTFSAPIVELKAGDVLFRQGESGGDLYVLSSGRLAVERDGLRIATIAQSDALVGEAGVLLGRPHGATVRAETSSNVRVVKDARTVLERHPDIAIEVARMLCHRLDATSALVSEVSRQVTGPAEQSVAGRILSVLLGPPLKR
jgi:CRP/FNR family cyclic AMP-dependent transcriptional regulator